ncbi:PIG-L family deacetylase [Natronoglycomyces albus]|uniref:PIG-L family deacetylase n=1 Tax=Natronoglycomyces albus TaxID=2811108 RepID=A0A895XJ99_9ACTN|nr:PIG-L family deacetylase [Natronoglycomyces albus]QSB05414.1 PIG-L family deacetylase [Natronoglycomyces albus]
MSKKEFQKPPGPKAETTPEPTHSGDAATHAEKPAAGLAFPPPKQAPKRPKWSASRRVLLTGGLATVGLAAAGAEAARSVLDSRNITALATLPPPPEGPTQLNIVAHPDDDLFFINPRLLWAAREGTNLINVCLTAGEANGRNGPDAPTTPDFAGYAAARCLGLRRAWASMIAEDADHPWDRYSIELESGQQVELCTLRDHPGIHMIFVSMWTDLGKVWGGKQRLMGLWERELDAQHVLHASDTAIAHGGKYTREDLHLMLLHFLQHYQPTSVALLDADPDWTDQRKGADQSGYSDHIDHTAAALFGWNAVREWGGRASVESYRGYYNRRWPRNLSQINRVAKGRPLDVYSFLERGECDMDFGCGDLKVTTLGTGAGYGASTHPRHSSGLALVRGKEGVPTPVAVRGMRLSLRQGQEWKPVAGAAVLPSLTVTGRHVFATAPEYRASRHRQRRDIMHYAVDEDQWTNLRNLSSQGNDSRHGGTPAAVELPDGTFVVAVRCPDLRLAVRTRNENGTWAAWTRLSGDMVQPDIAAVINPQGEPEFYGAAADDLVVWRRRGGEWHFERLGLGAHASAPAALWLPGERLVVAAREPETGAVLAHTLDHDQWSSCRLDFDGGVMAPVLASNAEGTIVVTTDNDQGVTAVALTDAEGLQRNAQAVWSIGGPVLVRQPQPWFDGEGRLHLLALGVDGELMSAHQETPSRVMPQQWSVYDTPELSGS